MGKYAILQLAHTGPAATRCAHDISWQIVRNSLVGAEFDTADAPLPPLQCCIMVDCISVVALGYTLVRALPADKLARDRPTFCLAGPR